MREIDRLFEIRGATLTLRRIMREIDIRENHEEVYHRVQSRIRRWPLWIKSSHLVHTEEFEELKRELKKIHVRRMRHDEGYRKEHQQTIRRKTRILVDAQNLIQDQDFTRKNYVLRLLYRRWMESGHLFQPYEYELWTEFQNRIQKLKRSITKHRTQVDEIRAQSAKLRYEIIQESRTLNPGVSEKEIRVAVQHLIKKWKEIPQVDVYQEQRFWSWTEKRLDVLFRKSG